jgi:hypothetical protein
MKKEKGEIYELYSPILSPDLHEREGENHSFPTNPESDTTETLWEKERRREEKGKQKALIENEVIRITRSSELGRHSNVCEIVAGSYIPQHRF